MDDALSVHFLRKVRGTAMPLMSWRIMATASFSGILPRSVMAACRVGPLQCSMTMTTSSLLRYTAKHFTMWSD